MMTLMEKHIVYPMACSEIIAAVWVEYGVAHSMFLAVANGDTVIELRDNPDIPVTIDCSINDIDLTPIFVYEGNFTEDKEIILKDYRKARKEADKLTKVL